MPTAPIVESTSAPSGYVNGSTQPCSNAACVATVKATPTVTASRIVVTNRSRRLATGARKPKTTISASTIHSGTDCSG